MEKRVIAIALTLTLILSMTNSVFAEGTSHSNMKEISKEEIIEKTPSITPREATISMLLNSGWTVDEIDEWLTEEMLLEYDQNAKAISNNDIYTVNRENTETGDVVSEQLSRQEFEYGVNATLCSESDHNNTELISLSSNGVLDLQPIFGVGSVDDITANDRTYYRYSGNSGASIWNADSECYIKQSMALVWMANDNYVVQYRFEWKTEPFNVLSDSFAVALATDLIIHENPRQTFTFKYDLMGESCVENLSSSGSGTWSKLRKINAGPGYQVDIEWPYVPIMDINTIYATHLRGYLEFFAHINNRYTYEQFLAYAQYYHGKIVLNTSPSISLSTSGLSVDFGISPSWCYITESHAMDVRTDNPYL